MLVAGVYFMRGINKANELEKEVKEERKKGLMPTWGKKVQQTEVERDLVILRKLEES